MERDVPAVNSSCVRALAESQTRADIRAMNGARFSIRLLRPDDRPAIAALDAAAWREAYAGIIPGVALARVIATRQTEWQDGRHAPALVVLQDDQPRGYATFGPARGQPGTAGEIFELYLMPEWQGIGLGARLFHAAGDALRTQGRTRLIVWSLMANARANAFYAAMGGQQGRAGQSQAGGTAVETLSWHWPL